MKILLLIIICILIVSILSVYAVILHRIIGKNRDTDGLLWAFGIIATIGFIFHMVLFSVVTKAGFHEVTDISSMLIFSLQYSLEMFLANTIIFKGEVMAVLKEVPVLFYIYVPVYGMAVITSCMAVFHFISRWLYSSTWLRSHRDDATKGNAHIFIGCNSASRYLADNIHEKSGGQLIIFLDLPETGDTPQGLSVVDIIARFFKDDKNKEDFDKYVVLKARKGMKELLPWLQNNNVYILSNDQKANLDILEELWENICQEQQIIDFKGKIYCHAKKEGLVNRYATIPDKDNRINFIDSSFLAVEYLKKDKTGELLPVNFVKVATGKGGGRLGYVTSGFNCAVIGFGETGREAMKFLYEFGAFPNESKGKAPFECHIFDSAMDKAVGEIGLDLESLRSTVVSNDEFLLHKCETGSSIFISELKKVIRKLNYIVVALGDDKLNLETALDIAELAKIEGRAADDKLCIAVRMSCLSCLDKCTLDNANKFFDNCIHVFGQLQDIWKMEIISNDYMNEEARKFFDSYTELASELNKRNHYQVESWDDREGKLHSEDYEARCGARRKIMQDYSNCLHKTTKQKLCEGSKVDPDAIFSVNQGPGEKIHCMEGYSDIFENLAICEHLRWEASHLVMGYRKPSDTDDNLKRDINKVHDSIRPYQELSESTRHFDWLVVKNSL